MRAVVPSLGAALLLCACGEPSRAGPRVESSAPPSQRAAAAEATTATAAAARPPHDAAPAGMLLFAERAMPTGQRLSGFYIDRESVQGQDYARCVAARQCNPLPAPSGPMTGVPWSSAHAYCLWAGKRLPTELELALALETLEGPTAHEWAADWYADCGGDLCGRSCAERCPEKDPRGPCDGAPQCGGMKDRVRRSKGGVRAPGGSSYADTGFRCASSTVPLRRWPPLVVAEPLPPPPEPRPPSERELATFTDLVEDDDVLVLPLCTPGAARSKCRDPESYVVSNEPKQHLWAPYIANLGGGYVGVGADQSLGFAAHARSEWVWILDYDPIVVRLHTILKQVILACDSRDAFVRSFRPEEQPRVFELVRASLGRSRETELTLDVLRFASPALLRHYARSTEQRFGWLASDEAYAHVRRLHRQARIVAVKGNLLTDKAMPSIARAAKRLGVAVRVYYPSNADDLWRWTDQYRANVAALPFDERSVVLRTVSQRTPIRPGGMPGWHYMVQSGLDLQHRGLAVPAWDSAAFYLHEGQRPDPKQPLVLVGLP